MLRINRLWRGFAGAALAALFVAGIGPALASFTYQSTVLSGAAIRGLVPQGKANLNQAMQPNASGRLVVELTNVNLPVGTRLAVTLDRRPVGTLLMEANGLGVLSAAVPFQVGRLSRLVVALEDGTPVLFGGTPWTVPWLTTP
jgi:hypothetical protein